MEKANYFVDAGDVSCLLQRDRALARSLPDDSRSDNGVFASAEVRLPILRIERVAGVLQVIPFVDFGIGWNSSDLPDSDPNTLVGVSLG
jgi:outer membrane protein assembly factor BamA